MKTFTQQFNEQHDKLWDLRNICYSDKSNDLFDELHDDLLYQVDGYDELYDNEEVTEADVIEITKLVKSVEKYYRGVTTLPNIEWTFG